MLGNMVGIDQKDISPLGVAALVDDYGNGMTLAGFAGMSLFALFLRLSVGPPVDLHHGRYGPELQ